VAAVKERDGGIDRGAAFFWSIVDEEDSVEWTGGISGHTKGSPSCVSDDDPPYKEHKESEQTSEDGGKG